MDFEDNNPFGVSDEEGRRQLLNESQLFATSAAPSTSHAASNSSPTGPGPSIVISEATKISEGSSRGHIAYSIRLANGTAVRRRYSEFESLRKLLRMLFPCVVVPSIPEKHSFSAYAANPTHAKDDVRVIEHRQRTLAKFLNRCISIPQIHDSWALERFLDPNTSWKELMLGERVSKLPKSALQAPPTDPASATQAHSYLPIPSGGAHFASDAKSKNTKNSSSNSKSGKIGSIKANNNKANNNSHNNTSKTSNIKTSSGNTTDPTSRSSSPESGDEDPELHSDMAYKEYENAIGSGLGKRARRVNKHYAALAAEYADFGGQLNSFSLDSHGQFEKFAPAVEKVGQAVDQGYLTTTQLVDRLGIEFTEPLTETVQLAATARQVLKYRYQRELQVQLLKDALAKQREELVKLQQAESEAERMNSFLHADDRINAATSGTSDNASKATGTNTTGTNTTGTNAASRANATSSGDPTAGGAASIHSHSESELGDSDLENEFNAEFADDLQHEGNKGASNGSSGSSAESGQADIDSLMPAPKDVKNKRGFKLPGLSHLNHAIQGIIDVDPQATRRSNITRMHEGIQHNQEALAVAEVDAKVAAAEVQNEISRYEETRKEDIRQFVRAFVRCHIEWAQKNLESWVEAKQAIADS